MIENGIVMLPFLNYEIRNVQTSKSIMTTTEPGSLLQWFWKSYDQQEKN